MLALATGTAALAGVTVIDGDTLDVDGVRIRLLDVDTRETIRSRCNPPDRSQHPAAAPLLLGVRSMPQLDA